MKSGKFDIVIGLRYHYTDKFTEEINLVLLHVYHKRYFGGVVSDFRNKGFLRYSSPLFTQFQEVIYYTKQSESGEALSPVVLAVGGVLVLSLVGTVWIVLLKLAQNKKEGEIRETVAPGNGCTFQNGEQECIYNDVRESQMMENSAISLSGKCTSLKHDPNRNIPKNHCRSLPRRQYAQWRNQLTRSKTLAPGHYGGYNRYSDDYNHLHFDKMPALPDNTTASISMDDYGIMKPKYEKTSSQNTNAEVRMSADKKKHPTMSRSETKCRPYSSVKYNRKVEME
ncbi:uncharacterized protein LOC125647227 isoform X4 [Ostrea edulis]|uniref:uncharacterized protein LOC125647227 isoform X4 n=1 Tax=Ostrea edulis TaxID=37623 RepID=UPI0024AE9F77|nr:uncharacterized protein LOC125647227 isoform X4 [Ostrea edulis]